MEKFHSVENLSDGRPLSAHMLFPRLNLLDLNRVKSLAETQTIHDFDICTYHKRVKGCSNQEKLILINNVFVPDTEFVFPKNKRSIVSP